MRPGRVRRKREQDAVARSSWDGWERDVSPLLVWENSVAGIDWRLRFAA